MKSVSLFKGIQRSQVQRMLVLVLLLVLVVMGAVPGYWTGNWPWAQLPSVTNLKEIRKLRTTGLEISGWHTIEQEIRKIGGHQWSYQKIEGEYAKPIRVLLLPQSDSKSQPQVEWEAIKGFYKWQTDSQTRIRLAVNPSGSETEVEALFFRAYPRQIFRISPEQWQTLSRKQQQQVTEQQQTLAILQWYAWPGGGHPAPSRWFWADQLAQLRRNRVPWVAVCLQIPIEPLGDIEASRSLAESLAKMVQTSLMTGPLAKASREAS